VCHIRIFFFVNLCTAFIAQHNAVVFSCSVLWANFVNFQSAFGLAELAFVPAALQYGIV
jgi:hypothetical protein